MVKKLTKRFGRFLIVGAANTLISYLVFLLLFFTTSSVALSLVSSSAIGIIISYNSNMNLVWKTSRNYSFLRFLVIQLIMISINWILLHLIALNGLPRPLFQAFLMPFFAITQYMVCKRFVF